MKKGYIMSILQNTNLERHHASDRKLFIIVSSKGWRANMASKNWPLECWNLFFGELRVENARSDDSSDNYEYTQPVLPFLGLNEQSEDQSIFMVLIPACLFEADGG